MTLNPGVYILLSALLKVNSGATLRVAPGGDGVFFYLVRDAGFGDVNAPCGSWTANTYLLNSDSTFAIEAGTVQSCGFAIPFASAKSSALIK